jgi:protein-disulfide isomerase
MDKRFLLAGLAALPFLSTAASAATQRNTATWKVPPGVKKIRVRSWNADGTVDLDRTLNVSPNQTFRIDAIED